ncbi:MAG: PAS domain S-box protein [Deltaproteobacteria bacterium]|nr:PAS domain S-box protein [Deltaproteobacteria bacterium]
MRKKTGFIKLIQLWGIILLTAIGASIIILDIVMSWHDFNHRADQMRKDYVSLQKQIIKREVDSVVAMINYKRTQSEAIAKTKIRARDYEAYSIAQNIYRQNKRDKTASEIQKMILDALRAIRFENGDGYYFITRLNGLEILFSDKPELEGTNLLNMQDTRGQYVIRDLIKIVKLSKEGFYQYHWSKPGMKGNDFKKISFVKLFEPYGWFIGTGLYTDDVELRIKKDLLLTISRIRFGKEGYIFINRLNGDALVSNGKLFDGTKKLWEVFNKNPGKMKNIFKKEYNAALKPGGDYIYYSFIKLNDPKSESSKVSFIHGIPGTQYLVGAGVYLDDIEKDIAAMQIKLNDDIKEKAILFILIVIGITGLFLVIFDSLTSKLKNDFNLFVSFFKKASNSDEKINLDHVQFSELDRMARNANKMLADKAGAKKALVHEKERLLTTIHSIGDAVITTDCKGRVELLNVVAETLTGFKSEKALGKPLIDIFNIFNAKTKLPASNPVDEVLKKGKIVGLANHTMLLSKDGSKYQIADSAAPIRDVNGKITGVVLVFRDVTQEYRMRQALVQSEANLRSIFEAAKNVAFIKIDCNGGGSKIIGFSPGAENIFGYKSEEVMGRQASIFHLPDDVEKFSEIMGKMNENKKSISGESVLVRKSGETFPALFTTHPVFKDGEMTANVRVYIDITERKKAEERFRLTADVTTDLIYEWDVATDCLEWFGDIDGVLGYRPGEIPRTIEGWASLIHPDDLAKLSDSLERHRKSTKSISEEYRVRKQDGSWVCWSDKGTPILNNNGEPVKWIGGCEDITEQKRVLEELQKIEKLKSVGTMAGGIAHDFNNILTGIYGNISMGKAELSKDHPCFKFIEEAEKSMTRATLLTKQLLTFAKGGSPVKEDVSIATLVRDVVGFDLSGSNVKPVFDEAEDLWMADVDKGQIQQVFSNLTINADQAMPDGGHLSIKFENEEIFTESLLPGLAKGRYVKITVKDEGTGIDRKYIDRIFDPYFSTKQAGSGLGLAITHSILTKHGGLISVSTQLGEGTSFTVYLPASGPQEFQRQKQAMTGPLAGKQTEKILVMDDEDAICKVASKMLEKMGFSAETAPDGEKAIEMYKHSMDSGKGFDLVLMDLTIPGGMGGKRAVRKILAIDPKAKVIVSSGYADDPVMSSFAEYGFQGIITKPYTMSNLERVLTMVLKK